MINRRALRHVLDIICDQRSSAHNTRQRAVNIPARDQLVAIDARQMNHFREIFAGIGMHIGMIMNMNDAA